jgi:hypothetical protein
VSDEPVFLLAGEVRAGRRIKLVSENWLALAGGSVGILTGAARFLGDRLSGDLGVGLFVDDGRTECCLPVVNLVYHFGRGR